MENDQSLAAITLPELGLPSSAILVSVWLVPLGTELVRGDRVVEIFTGEAIVDLPAPVSGRLVKKELDEDDPVQPGQVLGWIRRHGYEASD